MRQTAPTTGLSGSGFSLVEVVMSLGIVSFALVAMLGLLSVGFKASKVSNEDTLISTMTSRITAELRADPAITTSSMSVPKEYYFDSQGKSVASATGALYYCQATLKHPTSASLPDVGNRYAILVLDFSWPTAITDKTKRPYKETIHVTIPR